MDDDTVVTESGCERRRRSAVSSVVSVAAVVLVPSDAVLASVDVAALPPAAGVESPLVVVAWAETKGESELTGSPDAPPPHAANAAAQTTARPKDREAGSGRWDKAITDVSMQEGAHSNVGKDLVPIEQKYSLFHSVLQDTTSVCCTLGNALVCSDRSHDSNHPALGRYRTILAPPGQDLTDCRCSDLQLRRRALQRDFVKHISQIGAYVWPRALGS